MQLLFNLALLLVLCCCFCLYMLVSLELQFLPCQSFAVFCIFRAERSADSLSFGALAHSRPVLTELGALGLFRVSTGVSECCYAFVCGDERS